MSETTNDRTTLRDKGQPGSLVRCVLPSMLARATRLSS